MLPFHLQAKTFKPFAGKKSEGILSEEELTANMIITKRQWTLRVTVPADKSVLTLCLSLLRIMQTPAQCVATTKRIQSNCKSDQLMSRRRSSSNASTAKMPGPKHNRLVPSFSFPFCMYFHESMTFSSYPYCTAFFFLMTAVQCGLHP